MCIGCSRQVPHRDPTAKCLKSIERHFDFQNDFLRLLREAEESSKIRAPTTMKKFEDSEKAKKPVRSMIENGVKSPRKKQRTAKKKGAKKESSDGPLATGKAVPAEKSGLPAGPENGVELSKEELIRRKREEFIRSMGEVWRSPASPRNQMLRRRRARKHPGCGHWVAVLTRKSWIIALPPMEPLTLPRLRTST